MSVARMTFVEIKQIIKRGNLAVLGRSSKDQSAYDTFTANIQKEWQSMSSYLLCTKMGIPSFVNDEGMKEANIPKSQPVQFHLLKNDFPYNFEDDVHHYILWQVGGVGIEQSDIESSIKQLGDMHDILDSAFYINPPHLKSVRDIDHAHIVIQVEA